jgi:hypothetical protein
MRHVTVLVLCLAAAACSKGHNKEVCKQAADHYGTCVKQMLGDEMHQMVKAKEKDGIEQCTGDDRTVAMYEKCLPEKDCDKFMSCIQDYALANGP